METPGLFIGHAIWINTRCFCKQFQNLSGICRPKELKREKVGHNLTIHVRNFDFGGVLQLAKPTGHYIARLSFNGRKLLLQKKWVNICSYELREFVKVSFSSHVV